MRKNVYGRRYLAAGIGLALFAPSISHALEDGIAVFNLELGKMANYGANPWYTAELAAGVSPMKFIFDTGAHFMWATSDECRTPACNSHQKVNTMQPQFSWIDQSVTTHSFGPWGSMETKTGQVPFQGGGAPSLTLPFFASVNYKGLKFRDLAWGGGIGFPSESDEVKTGSGFYFASLYASGAIAKPVFSLVTSTEKRKGAFYLGGENRQKFNENSRIRLEPKKNTIKYLWGTNLYQAQLGGTQLPSLSAATFYLDTGSSEFKGDSVYLDPILDALQKLVDRDNRPVFEPITSGGKRIGLVYAGNGDPSRYKAILPDFTLTMGQSCGGAEGLAAKISLDAQQYSYLVQEGDYKGRWVVAFTVLDGVGGLLVGSTFTDHFYTTFNYDVRGDKKLSQGNMYLYTKKERGGEPAALSCVLPNPVLGVWHNSYCSQVDLQTTSSGEIRGVYTSHTGSTGSSNVVGWLGKAAAGTSKPNHGGKPVNPNGTPVALGIQWRLINDKVSDMDNSWRWVSTFSGQYFPAQRVSQQGQKDYRLVETLELLNGLEATAVLKGLADTAPLMWPQTLVFTREAPDYCTAIDPAPPIPFQATAKDYVTGKWTDSAGNTLDLKVNMNGDGAVPPGTVTGSYTDKAGEQYIVSGLVDAISGSLPDVAEQGVALAMRSNKTQAVKSMAGGVSLADTGKMSLWSDTVTSTNWSGRYAESTMGMTSWTRAK